MEQQKKLPNSPLRMQVQEPNAVTKGHMKLKMTLVEVPLFSPPQIATRKLPAGVVMINPSFGIYTQCRKWRNVNLKRDHFQNHMFIEPNQQFFLRAGSSFSGELRSGFWTLTWIILLKFRILVKLQKLKFRQDLLVFSFQPVPLEKLPKNLVSTKHPSVQKNLCHATRTLKILSKKKLEEKNFKATQTSWWLNYPSKTIVVILDHFPRVRGENDKNIRNHQRDNSYKWSYFTLI